MDAASQISEALFEQLDTDALIDKAMMTALDVVGAESGSVLLADPETKQLIFRQTAGRTHVEPGTAMPWDKGLAGSVYQTGKPAIIKHASKDRRHYGVIDAKLHHVTRDMVVLPLMRWRGEPIGVLEVLNKKKGTFTQDDLGLLTIVSAVTASAIERARLYEEAQLAEVVRFIGSLSHDVKNMLLPVTLGAGIIKKHVDHLYSRLGPKERDETRGELQSAQMALNMMRISNTRILDLMGDIANCVKGASTKPDFGPCSLEAVVGQVFETLRWLASEKGVALFAEGVEGLPEIQADERRLFNAFYNLVNNAIAEVPPEGSITITGKVDEARKGIVVSVKDTGRGMSPEVRDSLFSPHTKSRKPHGTGLGTKIVKDVITAHGGTITVDSQEGGHAIFTIFLPMRPLKS